MQQSQLAIEDAGNSKLIQRTPHSGREHRRSNSSRLSSRNVLTKYDQEFLLQHVRKLEVKHSELLQSEMTKIMDDQLSKLVGRSQQYCRTTRKVPKISLQNNTSHKVRVQKGLTKLWSLICNKFCYSANKTLNSKVLAFNSIRKLCRNLTNKNKSATFRRRFIQDDFDTSVDVEASNCGFSKKSSTKTKNPFVITYNSYKVNVRDLERDTEGCLILNLDGRQHTTKIYSGNIEQLIMESGPDSKQHTHRRVMKLNLAS